ncbi:acyltransferase family protein [Anaerococcus urinomassiliensis]|uniref:acyltransferase family protein n=1 Tax=Anaerococcus urinomassiliensis TaxID=1745712 RepID=UPI00093D71D1|nr:acyltransferase family protein [Anaerococcus urinomassiliensis]
MKIKGLDYIRFLGIFLVLSYHFFPNALPGGFLGVNMLFVLSGFLINFHLIDSLYKDGSIDFKNFYFKRFVRIFPAVLLMLSLTTIFAFAIDKDYTVRFFDQFLAAFSYNYNFFEIMRGGSYENQFIKQLFMHTWSLAIEVHFYIFWPWVMASIYNKVKGKRNIKRSFSKKFMEICIILYVYAYILTFLLVALRKENISFIYFFDLARMGSFVFGSMLGIFVKRFSFNRLPYNKLTMIFSGLILLMSLLFSYDNRATYFIGFLLTDIITGILILVGYSNKNLDEGKVIPLLSEYSYGMYVFHWPAFVIISSKVSSTWALVLSILVTILLVLFNYHIFEPIFVGKDTKPISDKISIPKIDYNKYQGMIHFTLVFIILLSFSIAYTISDASDDMVSLEKSILQESIKQDIDKIYMDRKKVSDIMDKDNDKINSLAENQAITVIGDSVLLGNREMLQENIHGLYVTAEGSRLLESTPELLMQMENEGNLGSIVVIAMGTNAVEDPENSLEEIVKTLPDGKRLIFVTCYDNRYEQPHRVSVAMEKIAPKYKFVTIMPWEKEAMAHPEYYAGTDGVHFYGVMDAYDAYLKMLKESIRESLKNPAKGE